MENIPSFTEFYTSQVVQEFFHQQYLQRVQLSWGVSDLNKLSPKIQGPSRIWLTPKCMRILYVDILPNLWSPQKKTTSHGHGHTTKQLRICVIYSNDSKCTSKGLVICGLGCSGLEFEKYGSEIQLTGWGLYFHHFPRKNPLRTTNGWIPAVRSQEIHVDSPLSNCFARHPLNTVWATQTLAILGMLIDSCLSLPFLYHWKEICRQVSTSELKKKSTKKNTHPTVPKSSLICLHPSVFCNELFVQLSFHVFTHLLGCCCANLGQGAKKLHLAPPSSCFFLRRHCSEKKRRIAPLKTNMTLENPHFQEEIHLQMVDVLIVMLVFFGGIVGINLWVSNYLAGLGMMMFSHP